MAYRRRNREFEERIARLAREKNYQPAPSRIVTTTFTIKPMFWLALGYLLGYLLGKF